MSDLTKVSGSRLWFGPASTIMTVWSVNQQMEDLFIIVSLPELSLSLNILSLSLSVCVCPYVITFQINSEIGKIKLC